MCTIPGVPLYDYICNNGVKASGTTTTENTQKCSSCDPGYLPSLPEGSGNEVCLRDETVPLYDYICTNGVKAGGTTTTENTQKCKSDRCDLGFTFNRENERCLVSGATEHAYECTNGVKVVGTTPDPQLIENCARCNTPTTFTNGDPTIHYALNNHRCLSVYQYQCDNGTPQR